MKLVSWNIRGSNSPQKRRILKRKIAKEKSTVMMLQEIKCSKEKLKIMGSKIWRGSDVIALDVDRSAGGLAILWNPQEVCLSNFVATSHILSATFHVIGLNVRGIISNVNGPFWASQKLDFLESLESMETWVGQGHQIVGGNFNMIINMEDKKGSQRHLSNTNQCFGEVIDELNLVDVKMENSLFTWHNKQIGERYIASQLDIFLVLKSILMG